MTRLERDGQTVRERKIDRRREIYRERERVYCELGLGSGPRTESVQIHRLNLHLGTKQIHTHTHRQSNCAGQGRQRGAGGRARSHFAAELQEDKAKQAGGRSGAAAAAA